MRRNSHLFLALFAAGASINCSEAPTSSIPAPQPASTVTSMQADLNNPHAAEARWIALGYQVAGFGGFFLAQGNVPTVYLRDVAARSATEALLKPVLAELHLEGSTIAVRQGQFSFVELAAWRDNLGSLWSRGGIRYMDLDESKNRIRIGVADASTIGGAREYLVAANIPKEAVVFEISGPVQFAASLRDRVRPLRAGLLVNTPRGDCSIGPTGYVITRPWGIRDYFLIPTHCTAAVGGTDSGEFYQGGSLIGTESIDKPFYSGGSCPSGYVCRASDAALVGMANAGEWRFEHVAKTLFIDPGTIEVDPNYSYYIAAEKTVYSSSGEIVQKIGAATGRTFGAIDNTCIDVGFIASPTNILFPCQFSFVGDAQTGDSGAAVTSPGDQFNQFNQTLHGMVIGGVTVADGTRRVVFSHIIDIKRDLGGFTTVCTGSNCTP